MAAMMYSDIINYFKCLKEVEDTWKVLSQKAEKRLQSLVNQIDHHRIASNIVEGAEMYIDMEMRGKLIYKIRMGIEIELRFLLDYLVQLRFANRGLKNALDGLELSRSDMARETRMIEELLKGTSYQPKLNDLLQWAVEGFQFYDNIRLRIDDATKVVDYKVKETIDKLVSSFKEDKRARKNLDMIFSFTQLMINDSIARQNKENERRMSKMRLLVECQRSNNEKKCDE